MPSLPMLAVRFSLGLQIVEMIIVEFETQVTILTLTN